MMDSKNFEVAGVVFELVSEEGDWHLNPAAGLTLPIALVSGMSAVSYHYPDQKQAILDALSPFQIVSKIWSCQAVQDAMMLQEAQEASSIVFVGSWFGQQSAMLARSAPDYSSWDIKLVDKDPQTCEVAKALIAKDRHHRRCSPNVVCADIFDTGSYEAGTLFVWNGLEHFEYSDVERFLDRHQECLFVFQSTSMPAKDHVNLASSVEDILKAVPEGWDDGILYKGELVVDFGSRYMLMVAGPGFNLDPSDGEIVDD